MSEVRWNGEAAKAYVRAEAVKSLTRAAIEVERRAKELVSIAYPPPSSPGEAPHKRTGRLRASITYEVDASDLRARVGTNVTYGKHLELGTSRGLRPRPWLRRALAESMVRIKQILGG
jgi:phage gpG-like protein